VEGAEVDAGPLVARTGTAAAPVREEDRGIAYQFSDANQKPDPYAVVKGTQPAAGGLLKPGVKLQIDLKGA